MLKQVKKIIKSGYLSISTLDTVIFKHYLFNLIIGILLSETIFLGHVIAAAIHAWLDCEAINQLFIMALCSLFTLIVVLYSLFRGALSGFIKVAKSSHPELIIFVLIGAIVSISLHGIWYAKYEKIISNINVPTLTIIAFLPIAFAFFAVLSQWRSSCKKSKPNSRPLFLNDEPISNLNDDLLDVGTKAERFAEIVLNNNSFDSLIFGVDSPWGAGKSSFISLCLNHWSLLKAEAPLVHIFEPIKYLDQTNFTDKLATELIELLQKNMYDPKLNSSFESYLDILQDNNQISLFGLNFKFTHRGSLSTAFEKLQRSLEKIDRKIIIVIDDLDRLSWHETKKILYSIKQSFKLKNVSYILCYDSENLKLNAKNTDAIEIVEFLEKYIHIKFSLFVDRANLLRLVSSDSKKLLSKIDTLTPVYVDQISSILAGLQGLYDADDYYKYAPLLGDLRKVKRLINSILICDIHTADIQNSDYDGGDLIKLLMIYISFPQLFKRIYDAETHGGSGVFSVVRDKSSFVTSPILTKNLDSYTPNEAILLKSLFDKDTLERENRVEISDLNRSNRACFNGDRVQERNLERYLNLIVNLKKQPKLESSTFFARKKEEFKSGLSIKELFRNEEFAKSEEKHKLLNVIGNSASELDDKQAEDVIRYILDNVDQFSALDRNYFSNNSRSSIVYILLKILDSASWRVNNTFDNSAKNISIITDWIFGEGSHQKEGIIFKLTQSDRLPLGYHDLLIFRLYCSADRASNLHNIHRALSIRYSLDAPTNGPVNAIAQVGMRQISQAVFNRFQEQYIKPCKNYFDDVVNLNKADLDGIAISEVSDPEDINSVEKTKNSVLTFVIYQLTNKLIQSGVGCGFYDPEGAKDEHQIFSLMNDYLFDVCFNPKINPRNHEYFLNYLLSNLVTPFETGEDLPMPVLSEFNKTLDIHSLSQYWSLNREDIFNLKLHESDKAVYNVNYTAYYQRDLTKIYELLDTLLTHTAQ